MEQKSPVKKKAILVGCSNPPGTDYLPGVAHDLFYFKDFLYSARSGCYLNTEIAILPNATVNQLKAEINRSNVDYLTIYFSGHGYTDHRTGKRMVCLRDGNMADTDLLNASKIQLIIIDACRNYLAQIGGLPQYGDPLDGVVLRSKYSRAIFDNYIRSANTGKMIVHGTQLGCVSYDTISGGVFTSNLLQTTSSVTKNMAYEPIFFSELIPILCKKIKKTGYDQLPEIAGHTPYYNLPFILDVPPNEDEYWHQINSAKEKQRSRSTTNVAWGLAAVAAIALAADNKKATKYINNLFR